MVNHKRYFNLLAVQVLMSILVLQSTSSFASPVVNTPESVPAPNRGIIAVVSNHYKTMPSFYDVDRMPVEHITRSVDRRFIMGGQSSLIRWDIKAGTRLPTHFHVNEQITRVEKGELEVYSQGRKYVVKAGQVMVFPPNVPHEFITVSDTTIFEQHTPARQDFINGDFDKWTAANIPKK